VASNDSSRNPEPALPPMGDSVVASLGSMDAGSNGSNGLSQLSAIPSGAQPSMGPAATSRLKEFSPEQVLGEQVEDLERWVLANLQRDRRSLIQFWLLRVPALSCALLAASSPVLGIAGALPGLSAGVALLLAIDSVWPGSTWRGPMRRALYDLRQLQNSVKLRWDRVRLAHPDPTSAKRVAYALALLDAIQQKRETISRYLTGYVASPSVGNKPF